MNKKTFTGILILIGAVWIIVVAGSNLFKQIEPVNKGWVPLNRGSLRAVCAERGHIIDQVHSIVSDGYKVPKVVDSLDTTYLVYDCSYTITGVCLRCGHKVIIDCKPDTLIAWVRE